MYPNEKLFFLRWGLFDWAEAAAWTIGIAFILSLLIRPKTALKNWHHHFAGLELASRDLYMQIIEELKERQVPDLSFAYERNFESGIFSPRREYLCIEWKKYNMDVCCIGFGTG